MYTRGVFLGFCGFFLLSLATGCGGAGYSRTVTDKASTFLSKKVDYYEADADKQRFESLKLANDKLINTFKGALSQKNHPKFEHDPRLDAVAHLYASAIGVEDTRPSSALVDWALRKLGVAANVDRSEYNWSSYYNPQERLSVSLRKFAMDYEAKGEKYRFGLARLEVASGKWAQATIVVEELATISEIPKEVRPGQVLLLRGKVHGKNKGAYLHLQLPGTNRLKLTLPLNDDGKFLVKVPMPMTPGRYWMEVLVDREPPNEETALSMPLYVGITEPSAPPREVLSPSKNPTKLTDWPAAILALYNEARVRARLPKLILDPVLTKLAQQQADIWVKQRHTPWISFANMTFDQGVLIKDYMARSIGTDNLEDAVRSDIDSAKGARVVFDKRKTHIGIGVAPLVDFDRDLVRVVQIAGTPDAAPPEPADLLRNLPRPVTHYANDEVPSTVAPWDADARALASAIAASSKVDVRYDPSLNPLAQYRARQGEIDDYVAMWMLSWAGCTGHLELSRQRTVVDDGSYPWFALEAHHRIVDDEDYKSNHYRIGLSRVQQDDGQLIEAMVLIKDELELEPFAKRYRPGAPMVLSGRFLAKPEFPQALLDRQGADILALDLDVDADGHFRAELPAPQESGLHLLEIAVAPTDFDPDDLLIPEWNRDVMLVPIYVDVEETERMSQLPFAWRKAQSASASWGDEVWAFYNQLRAEHGLPALRRSPAMDALVAFRMYREEHTYDVPSLFRTAQMGYGEGLGVPIRGSYVEGWHLPMNLAFERLLPSARRSLLSPDATMLALAVNKDGNGVEKVLLSAAMPQRLTAKGKLGGFRPIEALNDHLSKTNRLARRVVTAKKDALLDCYKEDLSCYNKFSGRVTLELVISGHGEVIGVRPAESTLENEEVERCLADELMGNKVPGHVAPQLTLSEVSVVFALGPEKRCEYEGKISFE